MRAILAARELAARRASDPLAQIRWNRAQDRWLRCDDRIKLFRAGNQRIGKSLAGVAEALYWARGYHPYRPVRAAPNEILWISSNQAQSLALQDQFHARIDPAWLAPQTRYDPKTRFGANKPAIIFRNGSRIQLFTDDQGPRAIQGKTAHYVAIDELCSAEMYREATQRIAATNGKIGITATMVNAPADWLRALTIPGEDGADPLVTDIHAPLTAENLQYADDGTPRVLEDGTLCDQAWIDEQRSRAPAAWAPIILDGEWETRFEGYFFRPWDPKAHVVDSSVGLIGTDLVTWHLGLDYAAADRDFGLVAVLVAVQHHVDTLGRRSESVLVVDEVCLPGVASSDEFARRIVAMLAKHGLHWRQLKSVYGDNPVQSRFSYKGNLETLKSLSRVLGISQSAIHPRLLDAKDDHKSAGSVSTGCRYIYEQLADQRLRIRDDCAHLIEAMGKWEFGDRTSKYTDVIDALRYALTDCIYRPGRPGATSLVIG